MVYKILNGLTSIILVMCPYVPQEILKQLDMDSRPSITWVQKWDLVPKAMKQFTISSYFWSSLRQNQNLEVRNLSLTTL